MYLPGIFRRKPRDLARPRHLNQFRSHCVLHPGQAVRTSNGKFHRELHRGSNIDSYA